jgi:hypothetical protein
MNGITRVLISIALLGACAAAMRLTMENVDSGTRKRQLLAASLNTKKAKKIDLKIQAQEMERIHIKPSQAGRIAGTYEFTTDALIRSRFSIADSTLQTAFREKGVLYAFYNAYSVLKNSYYFGNPLAFGVAELRLPKEVPLSLEFFMQNHQKPPRAFIDLRGLEIDNFNTVFAFANSFEQLNLDMAQGNPNTRYSVRNDNGRTNINFFQQSKGSMRLYSEEGQISISHYAVTSNIAISVFGKANSASNFRKRLSLKNSSLVWGEPKLFTDKNNLWVMSGQSKNATEKAFRMQVDLNSQARLEVWN